MKPWILPLVAGLLGCAPIQVDTRTTPGTDLRAYATYAQAGPSVPHPVVGDAVATEIAKVLDARGYRAASVEEADMVVSYQASGESRSRVENAGDPDADFYVVRDYIRGTVSIAIFDAQGDRLAWKGTAMVDVRSERDAPAAARRAVRAILKELPER